jgi:hypothetical protein
MKVEANAPGDDRVSLLCVRVIIRLLCTRKRLVPQGLTKVAQYFSAGLTFRNANVPLGTIDHCCAPIVTCGKKKQPFLSSLTGRTCFLRYFPAVNCWATFIESLRDRGSGKVTTLRTREARSRAAAHARQLKATRRRDKGIGRRDLPYRNGADHAHRSLRPPRPFAVSLIRPLAPPPYVDGHARLVNPP